MNDSQNTTRSYPKVEEDVVIDLLPLLRALIKKWWLILLVSCLLAALGFLGAKYLIAPTYQSSFSVYVNNSSSDESQTSVNSSDISAKKSLAGTYTKIIMSRTVLRTACQKAGLSYSYGELLNIVGAATEGNTEIITVTVTTTDPKTAKALADAVYATASDVVSSVINGSSMRAYDLPELPDGVYAPNCRKYAATAFFAGLILTCAVIVLCELLDTRVKSQKSLEERFGLVVLGSVPNFQDAFKDSEHYSYSAAPKSGKKGESTHGKQ